MRNLKELIEEIKTLRTHAADDLSDKNDKTFKTRLGRKNSAKLKLQEVFFDFRNLARDKVRVVIVSGPEAKRFTDLAKEMSDIDELSYNALYNQLAMSLDPRVIESSRESASYVVEVASSNLETLAFEMGIRSYPRIAYSAKYDTQISSMDDAKALIKKVVEEQAGADLATLFVVDHATRLFYQTDLVKNSFPIMMIVENEKDLDSAILSLKNLGNKAIVVSAGEENEKATVSLNEVSEETVLETFNQIQNK